jgi:hypothetical protein
MKPNAINPEHLEFPPDIYDVKYKLSTVLESGVNDPDDDYNDHFMKHGFNTYGRDGVKFYTTELYYALYYCHFLRHDYDTNCLAVDGFKFKRCYENAFKDGSQKFDNEIAKRPYPKNSEEYGLYVTFLKGWLNRCKSILKKRNMITFYSMKEDGNNAGIFSRIIELISDDLNLQQRIKGLAGDDLNLQQRIEKLVDSLGSIENSDQLKNDIRLIDEAIKKIFPSISDVEITRLKDNLENNQSNYISLTYIGKKNKLWKHLKEIRINGIDRNEIASVFSTYCKWKQTPISQPNELKYDEIYKKS